MKDSGARAERSVKDVMEMNKIFHDKKRLLIVS